MNNLKEYKIKPAAIKYKEELYKDLYCYPGDIHDIESNTIESFIKGAQYLFENMWINAKNKLPETNSDNISDNNPEGNIIIYRKIWRKMYYYRIL